MSSPKFLLEEFLQGLLESMKVLSIKVETKDKHKTQKRELEAYELRYAQLGLKKRLEKAKFLLVLYIDSAVA